MPTTLIASERFFYNGRNVEAGEQFEAEDKDVMLLTHHHTPKATVAEAAPEKPLKTFKLGSKTESNYKRRDLKAED